MPDLLSHLPEPLLDDLVANRWLPLVGAGLSRNAVVSSGAPVPLWGELGRTLAAQVPGFSYFDALDAVSAYAHAFSRARLVEQLRTLLRVDEARPGPVHEAFCRLPFDVVCTTNFDFLLESQYQRAGRYCRPVQEAEQLAVGNAVGGGAEVLLLKLHGDLHHPERLVATEEDYDRFLDTYPLVCTYFANLLITRTPVLIGYSLDDPDLRQLWRIVSNRLGRLRRPAYRIAVAEGSADVARFDRRGVRVVNLPGSKKRYGEILAQLFAELRAAWAERLLPASTVTEEDPRQELLLPSGAVTRLCLFALPPALQPWYRERVFPVVRARGFVPITPEDVAAPGDSRAATIDALLGRCELVVVDLGGGSAEQERVALPPERLADKAVLAVVERKAQSRGAPPDSRVARRPAPPFARPDRFLAAVSNWVADAGATFRDRFSAEPLRLLRKREYRAATVAAMSLLEARLRQHLTGDADGAGHTMGLFTVVAEAKRRGLLAERDHDRIDRWVRVRNAVVHGADPVAAESAREIVRGVTRITRSLAAAP